MIAAMIKVRSISVDIFSYGAFHLGLKRIQSTQLLKRPLAGKSRRRPEVGDGALFIKRNHSRISLNDALVGKQPATQPRLKRAGVLFLERLQKGLPGN